MVKVQFIKSRLPTLTGRSVQLPKKEAPEYVTTPEHRAWRREVIRRAGFECEKCGATNIKLFADHIKEVRDGGSKLDVLNGQALCATCHSKKTLVERKKRLGLE